MKFNTIIGITSSITAFTACKQNYPNASMPNIIIIYTDDQRADAVGYSGNPYIKTPNIDKLAAEGMHFTNAFVSTSISSPSRAALLTGRYGSANGISTVSSEICFNKGEVSLSQILKQKGYTTGVVGKWHIGNKPDSIGFDYYSVFHGNGSYFKRKIDEQGKQYEINEYIEKYIADQGIYFVNEVAKEKPFFLFLCTQLPHMNSVYDWEVKKETLEYYQKQNIPLPLSWNDDMIGKPEYIKNARSRKKAIEEYHYDNADSLRLHICKYYAAITEMDAELGRFLEMIYQSSEYENTYIFFMGDNGWFLGEHQLTSKVLAYEESIRVPFIAQGPGIVKGSNDAIVMNLDIMPTILDILTIPIPKNLHGESLWAMLQGKKQMTRKYIYYEAPVPQLGSYPIYALRFKDKKYIESYELNNPDSMMYKEYYDLKNDAIEMKNISIADSNRFKYHQIISDCRNKYSK